GFTSPRPRDPVHGASLNHGDQLPCQRSCATRRGKSKRKVDQEEQIGSACPHRPYEKNPSQSQHHRRKRTTCGPHSRTCSEEDEWQLWKQGYAPRNLNYPQWMDRDSLCRTHSPEGQW